MFSDNQPKSCVKSTGTIPGSFYFASRSGDDQCYIDTRATQSSKMNEYLVQAPHHCNLQDAKKISTDNRSVLLRDGYGVSASSIDVSNKLRNEPVQTNPRQRANIDLQKRPFSTVPYMGRGRVATDLETDLWQQKQIRDVKSASTVTEMTFTQQYTPLVENIQETIQNPNNLIQENARSDWVRGGIDTRMLNKDYSDE